MIKNNLNVIIYDKDNMNYMSGAVAEIEKIGPQICHNFKNYDGTIYNTFIPRSYNIILKCNLQNSETIKLDETMMKRIAKYNKEQEIKKIDEKIKKKEEQLKRLEDIINDREDRIDKLKTYISKLWDIGEEDVCHYEDDWDEYDD